MSIAPLKIANAKTDAPRLPLQGGRLPRTHAAGIAVSGSVLALTGVLLALFRYVLPDTQALSAYPHPWWKYVVMVHVFSVMPFCFFVGSIWWRHAVRHWRCRERRASGAIVVALALGTAVSGYLLYFLGSERGLEVGRWAHASAGIVGIVVYLYHAILGWRALRAGTMR